LKKEIAAITPEAIERLVAYHWPGNIRELENLMERTMLFCEGPEIRLSDLPPEVAGAPVSARQHAYCHAGSPISHASPTAASLPAACCEAVAVATTARISNTQIARIFLFSCLFDENDVW